MAATDVWLGPSGSETLLPAVNWISGAPGDYPQGYKKNFESAAMLSGRIRYNFKPKSQRTWTLEWGLLVKSDILVLQGLADLSRQLRLWNGLAAVPEWADVGITSFGFAPVVPTFRAGATAYYRATMTLEEAI